MARAGAKRSKQGSEESPQASSISKKRKTEKKKIAPQRVPAPQETMDPNLKSFSEKFKKPEDSLKFLLQNAKMSAEDFFKNYWQTKPLLMKAAEVSEELLTLFDLKYLESLVRKSENEGGKHVLAPERDYIFSKFVDGKRDDPVVDIITEENLAQRRKDKYGVQFNQPQRFQDALWAFVEKLECHLGSLVSSHAFLVPEGTKYMPPRFDDVEKFVLQTDGSSSWKLFKQKKDVNADFNDFVEKEDIGDEILSVTLKPGDVLYIPVGTIFESQAETEEVHICFSTYQGLTTSNFLLQTLPVLVEEETQSQRELRRGIPLRVLLEPETLSHEEYADMLVNFAQKLRSRSKPIPRPEGMIIDFMAFRLPPYGSTEFSVEAGESLVPENKVTFKYKQHVTWFLRKSTDTDFSEAQVDEETPAIIDFGPQVELVLCSSINNDRKRHMMIETRLLGIEGESLTMGLEFEPMLNDIYNAETPLEIKSLAKGNESAPNPLTLVRALYSLGAIEIH